MIRWRRAGSRVAGGVKSLLADNRRSALARKIDRWLVELHEGFENRNYDPTRNGEYLAMRRLRDCLEPTTIFDVGANVGDWTAAASAAFPAARIFSFEIVPDTYRELVARCGNMPNVTLHGMGLSDAPGHIDVYYSSQAGQLATCLPNVTETFHGLETQCLRAPVTTGDLFCEAQGIPGIDFLKIDVEGLEDRVLRGFGELLGEGRIKVIQFEYGYVNVVTKFLLKDFYELLERYDMAIGKIYPNYVDFRPYHLTHENFLGPNFLAVHSSLTHVIASLSR